MIICFNCNTDTKAKMDSMLNNDQHSDYSELISMAVANLWLLDREVGRKGAIVIGEAANPSTTVPSSRSAQTAKPFPVAPTKRIASKASEPSVERTPLNIPDLFLSADIGRLSVPTLDIKPEEPSAEELFALDRWLFGQYNRLLPAKANCRALAYLAVEHPDGMPPEEAASRIANAAALLGDYLASYDRRQQLGRDDALSTAFPRSGPDAKKSLARYANQFVGSVNSQGQLSGLLWDYRLAGLANGDELRLLPTEQGMKLARLSNPILDAGQAYPSKRFSPEEIAFLLEHICLFVPVEVFAFKTLLNCIIAGADTPDKLDETLRPLVPTGSNRSLSPSFLSSQRSGALSRMADLDLIVRVRKGVRISYAVTKQGQGFFESKNHTEKEI